jgi:HPt (histidine-containing phosphotransfer) domain-containing protein
MTGPVIDAGILDHLLAITGGDVEFLDELVDTYLEDGQAQVAALEAAVVANAIADLVRPAHTLKSSSANVGASRLADACRDLEAGARAGAVDDPQGRVAAIAAGFDEARDRLLAIRAERG